MRIQMILVAAISMTILSVVASPALARDEGRCPNGRSPTAAMWLSIAHLGLGEYNLEDWGPWSNVTERKFWFELIPGYGWPGYLQVKSALDAKNCKTNVDLVFKE